jgi:hypothetical protein
MGDGEPARTALHSRGVSRLGSSEPVVGLAPRLHTMPSLSTFAKLCAVPLCLTVLFLYTRSPVQSDASPPVEEPAPPSVIVMTTYTKAGA